MSNTTNTPTGFSFTTLFFGFLPALFRGNLPLAGLIFVSYVAVMIPVIGWFAIPMTFIWPAVVNRLHADGLLNPFPMSREEIGQAVAFFIVWLIVVMLILAVGMSAAGGV